MRRREGVEEEEEKGGRRENKCNIFMSYSYFYCLGNNASYKFTNS
jgi:hypothetical protein